RKKIENDRYVDALDAKYDTKNGKNVDAHGNLGDEVKLLGRNTDGTVDKKISVRETVTNYNFTYYGFKANPILESSLFTFEDKEERDNFHTKVICVTPAELNQIAQQAKDYNLDFDNNSESAANKAKQSEIDTFLGLNDTPEGADDATKTTYEQKRTAAQNNWTAANWTPQWDSQRLSETEQTQYAKGKLDLNVRLDLIERADMFYIHTQRMTRKGAGDSTTVDPGGERKVVLYQGEDKPSGSNSDDIDLAYKLYKDIVAEGEEGSAGKSNFYKMNTFFENDLEWEQVMKLIKRSSLDSGINIPILFNMLVGEMTDESVDADNMSYSNTVNDGNVDTHMQLFSNPELVGEGSMQTSNSYKEYVQDYAGNMNNIAKLYTILLQFDLHAVRNSVVNPENTEVSERRYVRRTFMGDIFKNIYQVPIKSDYQPADKARVANSATMTGVVPELESFKTEDSESVNENGETVVTKNYVLENGKKVTRDRSDFNDKENRSRIRVLCRKGDVDVPDYSNHKDTEQFKQNSQYLWNRFTFYPFDIITKKDHRGILVSEQNDEMRLRFLEWGYLESYYESSDSTGTGYPIFKDQSMTQALRRRVGTNGEDFQNVYVLHWPNQFDNLNAGQSMLGWYGGTEPNGQANNLLNMAYKIMGYPGKASDLEIKVRARDKVYSMMGRDEDGETDEIMLDYYREKNMYSASEFARLEGEEKNILVSAFNANSEPAFITSVSLHRSTEESTAQNQSGNTNSGEDANTGGDTNTGNDSNTENSNKSAAKMAGDGDSDTNTGEGGNQYGETGTDTGEETTTEEEEEVPIVFPDDPLTTGTKIALNMLLKKDNSSFINKVEYNGNNEDALKHGEWVVNYPFDDKAPDGTTVKQGNGILVEGGKTFYFHIPYSLKDFFEKRTDENGDEIGGYDQIVIYGYYYYKNKKNHVMSIKGVKHVINITPRELFDLE
ncbi:MAG: hypothetical protein J5819_07935, partial [Eubacterium sp.]|nr:hypothetical protein [Eubacterium sp.]